LGHQQIRPAVEQVHSEEECPTRNPIATIIRHDGSMPGFGKRRKALRFSALRALTSGSAIGGKQKQLCLRKISGSEMLLSRARLGARAREKANGKEAHATITKMAPVGKRSVADRGGRRPAAGDGGRGTADPSG
jgi:hypothetical protein